MSATQISQAVLLQVDRAPSGVGLLTFQDLAYGQSGHGDFFVLANAAQIDALAHVTGRSADNLSGAGVLAALTGTWSMVPHPLMDGHQIWALRPANIKLLPAPALPQKEAVFRTFVAAAVRRAQHLTGQSNAHDGALIMGWFCPGVGSDDPSPRYRVELTAKVMGPTWSHLWSGLSPETVLDDATADIRLWIDHLENQHSRAA